MDRKGFTLIELIASIALFSIIGTAIVGLYTTSLRMGRNAAALSDISDNESLVMERIEKLIINSGALPVFDGNILTTTSDENEYLVSFDDETKKLYLSIRKKDSLSGGDPEPLADNVTGFDVDFADYKTRGTVKITVIFTEAERSERSERIIYLRNKYAIN